MDGEELNFMKDEWSMLDINSNHPLNIDFLTKLYNRSYCLDCIERLMKREQDFSVFYIDLNEFKIVNDLYGHDVGDMVLKEVGDRFKSLENEQQIIARFGGDEFIGIFQSLDPEKINRLGQAIAGVLEDPIMVSESEFMISASLGVARYPLDADNWSDLMKLADMAMYKAKDSGLSTGSLVSKELTEALAKRKKTEKMLKEMDLEKDLFLEYQPIFNLDTGELASMEALVRWQHESEGVIYPNDFIQIAEEIDFVKDITKWVFGEALKQISEWNHRYGKEYKVSINVSDACIHNKIFFGNVMEMLDSYGVKAEWLVMELSEHSISVSPDYMKKLLSEINETGIHIYLDNFGIDPIILSDLVKFKIKGVKIADRFIQDLRAEDHLAVLEAMKLLAKGLGIKTVVKGIEEKEQHDQLKAMGFDKIQGFYFDQPLSKEAFEKKYLA